MGLILNGIKKSAMAKTIALLWILKNMNLYAFKNGRDTLTETDAHGR